MRYVLVGIVGSVTEQAQDLLTYHLPVLRDDEGQLFTPTREDWTSADLQPIDVQDHKFLTFIDEEQLQFVPTGVVIFVAGATFYNRCSRIDELREFSDVFHGWDILAGPFSWRCGTREEFGRLNRRMLDALETPFYEALFSSNSMRFMGEAERIFWVLQRLSDLPEADLLLLRGIYYHERRDATKYELVQQLAAARYYTDAETFDEAVEQRLRWLSRSRLREEAVTSSSASEALADTNELMAHLRSAYTGNYIDMFSARVKYRLLLASTREPLVLPAFGKLPSLPSDYVNELKESTK